MTASGIPPPDLLNHLRTLPDRCWYCGAHEPTQGHPADCQRPSTVRDQQAAWAHHGGRWVR